MVECAGCASATPTTSRWKAPLLFVGALLFCPCHLPVTFAAFAAVGASVGGAAWFFGHQVLVYATFSIIYIVLVGLLLRWAFRARDREREREDAHRRHASDA